MKRFATALLVTCISASAAHAAVIVTDNGTTAPTVGASDTGYEGPVDQRFGWDDETFSQTFTLPTAGIIDSIFIGYNGFDDGDTLEVDLSVNGSSVATGILLDGDDFSGDASSDDNTGETYWMQFDISSELVAVGSGLNTFTMSGSEFTGAGTWALAPLYNNSATSTYDGGALILSGPSNAADLLFAVTLVPEPSSLALLGLGGLLIARRRRG